MLTTESFRIRRQDERNIILEEFVTITDKKDGSTREDWKIRGYYGKLEDLVVHLLGDRTEIPEGQSFFEQLQKIQAEIKRAEASLVKEISTFLT